MGRGHTVDNGIHLQKECFTVLLWSPWVRSTRVQFWQGRSDLNNPNQDVNCSLIGQTFLSVQSTLAYPEPLGPWNSLPDDEFPNIWG